MTMAYFMKLTDAKGRNPAPGTATQKGHEGWIELIGWWPLSKLGLALTIHGPSASAPEPLTKMAFNKKQDATSTFFATAANRGTDEMTAILDDVYEKKRLRWTFAGVLVYDFTISGSAGDDRVTETVKVDFVKMTGPVVT
jgi:type VI protein secretion system component Hcp